MIIGNNVVLVVVLLFRVVELSVFTNVRVFTAEPCP